MVVLMLEHVRVLGAHGGRVRARLQMGPRKKFFDAIKRAVGKVDIIAEDLVRHPPRELLHPFGLVHAPSALI